MKLRAVLTIDIEARDFVDAAEHQRQVEAVLSKVSEVYPTAELVFRERRATTRGGGSVSRPAARPQGTGRLSTYVE